jgi:hypothetical protein
MNISKSPSIIPVAALLYGLMLIVVSGFQNFYQFHNDFWDVFFSARNMVATDTASWFNPQYPVGYTLLLKLISGSGSPILPAIILNCIFGGFTILACGYFYKQFLSKPVFLLCLSTIALYPTLFHYFTVGGGDPGSVFFFASGSALLFLLTFQNNHKFSPFFFSGLLMGVGALFRYHVLPAALLLLFTIAILYKSYFKNILVSGFAVMFAFLPQIIVNLVSGHAPLETLFSPNLYGLMYSLNWFHTSSLDLPKSAMLIIAQDPMLFIQKYLKAFLSYSPYYTPQLIALTVGQEKESRRFCYAAALFSALYFSFFSAFISGRQGLILLPLAILCAGLSIDNLILRFPAINRGKFFPVAAIAVILLLTFKDFRKVQGRVYKSLEYKKAELTLINEQCTNVRQVFSTDFTFYLQSIYPHVFYFNGGASRWDTYNFNEEYPEFPVNRLEDFLISCRKRGVIFLVLLENCDQLSPFFAEIYTQKKDGFSLLYDSGQLKVFKIHGQNLPL